MVSLRRLHRQSPGAGLVALIEAVRHVGLAALHRVLGGPGPRARGGGWRAVADLLAPTAIRPASSPPDQPAVLDAEVLGGNRDPVPPHAAAPGPVPAGPVCAGRSPQSPAAQRLLADELLGRSSLAKAIARSRLRPDQADAMAWAALVLAETDPSALTRPTADRLLRTMAAAWGAPLPGGHEDRADAAGTPAPGSGPRSGALAEATTRPGATSESPDPAAGRGIRTSADPVADGPARLASEEADDGPGGPAPAEETDRAGPGPPGLPTGWGGLLFLLNLAPAAGLPHAVLADPDLGGRSLPWLLQAVAVTLLPVPGDDPALAAFAGLGPAEPSPWLAGLPATAGERRAVGRLAERWAQAAASALGRPASEGAATVRTLAARRGTVVFAPAWIEVVLALDEVDVDVRVAGLDLDPGWVPWLGCVLRFRYE